jgi:putative Holliday junction resolvase
MASILGVDFGTRRIGLAVSDALGITAQGLETLERTNDEEDISRIADIVREREVGEIVVGRPVRLNGTRGDAVRECEAFADRLAGEFGFPVHMWDERLSTAQAERAMIEADLSRRKRKKARDRAAAQLILQSYLDVRQKRQGGPSPARP